MKLHLNLTLRRALLAAMAMVALHTAEAGMAPTNGHMYVTGEVSPTTTEWTTAWGSTTGVLSVGTSVDAGTLTLTSGNYTTPNSIFLGGKGYESTGTEAKDGTLNIQKDATLTANGSTNVGNSQIGGTGYLTLNGGKLNAGNALYVGVNAGSGIVNVTDGGSITVASGSTGAVFAMSHRTFSAPEDTVTLTGSSITVGAKGGVVDYTSIGHSIGTATLNLKASSTATFHDQLLVGEMGGSNGTIYVTGGSTLNMGSTTVLGAAAGATGLIRIEDGTAQGADTLVIGSKGTGTIEMLSDKAVLAANSIELGDAAGSKGSIKAQGGRITTDLLTIGTSGTGSVVSAAIIKATDIVIGKEVTGYGELTIKGTVTTDTLYAGEKGTGIVKVEGGTLTAKDANIVGIDSVLATEAGKTTLTNATVLAGELGTAAGAETEVTGELIMDIDGSMKNNGITNIASATVAEGSISNAGTLTTDTLVNSGIIMNSGIWNSKTSTTSTEGTIVNYSTLNVSGELTTNTLTNDGDLNVGITNDDGELQTGTMTALQGITGSGTTNVAEGSKLELSGASSQNKIDNDGSITLLSNATLTSGPLTGTGTTNVAKDSILQLTGDSSQNKIVNDGNLNVGTTDVAGTMAALQGITGTGTTNVAEGSELKLTGASSQNEINNDGSIILQSNATLTSGSLNGTGTTEVLKDGNKYGKWTITGQTYQDTIDNNGTITLQGAGRIDADTLSGTGTTTITIDGTTVATSKDLAIIEVRDLDSEQTIKVDIDTDNGASLVGKTFNFVEVNNSLINLNQDNFIVDKGWTINWDGKNKNISTGDTSTNGKQLSFIGGTDSMTFTKLGAIETKEVEVELPANVTIELEVVTETVLAVAETPKDKGVEVVAPETEEEIAAATDVVVKNDTILHSAELSQGVDADTQEEIRTNVVIGKGVTSSISDNGAIKVQSVVVNQKTTIDGGDAGSHDDEVKKETLGVSGVALVLSGKSDHVGTGKDDDAHLGFSEGTKEGTLTVKDKNNNTTKNEVKKLDLVNVEEQSVVSIKDMNMHSTHALTVASGTTITFNSVNLHVGGTTDVNLTEDVEVKVYDEQGNVTGTKIETVDTGAHLTVDSTITKATVKITGGSAVTFEKIDDKDHHSFGSTTFKESEVEIDSDSSLGDNAEHMQEIVFTGETSVSNSGNVNNAKFEKNSKLHNNNGTVDNVVISNGSHLTGKGNLKKVHVDKDSYFTVGSSPGKFSAEELTVDGKTSFYIITDSNQWDSYTGDSSQITAEERQDGAAPGNWGGISQLVVDGSVTLNGQVTFIYQHFDDAAGEFVNEDTATAREKMKKYFKEGSSIKFVDFGQNGNLTLGSNFSVDLASLPELEDGLFWDVNSLFTENTVYVMAEILEEPSRIANSLVSAGETVLNFGRLAEAQASLREAGTTRTWGSAIAMFDSIDSGSTTNGYDYSNWGAAVGIDHAFTKNTVVGVAFGCTWGENEAKEDNGYYSAGSIDQDAKMIGIYGVHKFQTKGLLNDVKLSAFAAYGMFENDSTRNGLNSGNTAKAEWDSDAWVLSASLSRDITTDSGVVFTPYVGVEYTTAGMDDFSEQGKSYAADYSADEDYSNLSVKVGVSVSKTYGSITPYANVAFISDVDRTAGEVTATGKRTITGKSALPGRNGFEIGVGATWQLTENLDVNAGYSAEIRDKATEHNARLGVGYTF